MEILMLKNTTEEFDDHSQNKTSAYFGMGKREEDGVLFAVIFCSVFLVMFTILLLLLCKVWALRRSIVPGVFHIEVADGPNGERITRPVKQFA